MHLNRLRYRKTRAGLLILAGALIAIIAASTAARQPAVVSGDQTAAISSESGT